MPNTISILDTSVEQRKKFDCGVHNLNDFLQRHSEPNHTKGFGNTFVLVMNGDVIGYYTISMSSTLEFIHIENDSNDTLPRYPIPVGLIGKLAVSKDKQKQGWGKWLLTDAIHKIADASKQIGAYALVVDAKDENAKKFYEQYGFLPFPTKPMSLYMLLSSIVGLIKEPAIIT